MTNITRRRFWARVFLKFFVLILLIWILLVLYPNPVRLITSLQRILNPHTDPVVVASIAEDMPDDPALIEAEVLELIPYSYDWETYGMPWYCPSVTEALQKGKGDCKARALVLSSILQAKGIPNNIVWSMEHVWVDYPGKVATSIEKNELYQKDSQTGAETWSLPVTPPSNVLHELWTVFIATMPGLRLAVLLCGLVALVGLRVAATKQSDISPKSRYTTTLLVLFLGFFGAHRFYTGRTRTAIIMLSLSIIGAATAWFVIGIPFILIMSGWALLDLISVLTGVFRDSQGKLIKNWR